MSAVAISPLDYYMIGLLSMQVYIGAPLASSSFLSPKSTKGDAVCESF